MAILKDLMVLGNSTFIGDTYGILPDISGNSGKVLAVNSGATGLEWVTQSGGGGGGASQLNDLSDVTISSAVSGQALLHNGTNWVNGVLPQEVLVCNITNQSTPVTLDKTTTEIVQAANSGKEVICIDPNNNFTYRLFAYSSTQVFFSAIYSNVCYNLYANIGTESWTKFSTTYQTQLASGTTIKTVNGNSLLGNGDIDTSELPSLTNNAGKVLVVNSGATAVEWTQPVTIYSGTSAPSSGTGSDGDIYIQTVS